MPLVSVAWPEELICAVTLQSLYLPSVPGSIALKIINL